jgi:L-threonylcarbamoyladenylate synthase
MVAFPTETVYGLGALAFSPEGVAKIFKTKGRPSTNPLIVHVHDLAAIEKVADLSKRRIGNLYERIAPLLGGPLTLVLPRHQNLPLQINSNAPTVAVRIPSHPCALDLLKHLDAPIAAPSANRSNCISPTTARHVYEEFGTLVPLIIDGGPCEHGLESTVLSLVDEKPVILRPGTILAAQIEELLGTTITAQGSPSHYSPGQGIRHYAPEKTRLYFLEYSPKTGTENTALLALFGAHTAVIDQSKFKAVHTISPHNSLVEVAHKLFDTLRMIDSLGYDAVVVTKVDTVGIGAAIMDRLTRACTR